MSFLTDPTRFLFFTGKGGVGKTSLSCATAISLSDHGHKVLLVCTDPASNLDDVLGCAIGSTLVAVKDVPKLQAININPEEAAAKYREKVIGPYRDKLPVAALASMEEQLSGACTMEIAAFDEFAGLLGNEEALLGFDYVIFDTAPTGHTLRLLQLPSAWDGFIESNTTGTSCLGPLAGLTRQHQMYKHTIATLTDLILTTVVLVCRADTISMDEAARTSAELSSLGMDNQELVINGVFDSPSEDDIARAWKSSTKKALSNIPDTLVKLERITSPLLPFSPLGVENLRHFFRVINGESVEATSEKSFQLIQLPPALPELFADIAHQGKGVIMTMGKGGVGKTTIATELAQYLAQEGHEVLLATTDPASHLDFSLSKRLDNLTVARIDPKEEIRKYTDKVMSEAGSQLDEQGKKLLEEDLRSPCTEEIAVFQAFAHIINEGKNKFIVLDTAPTGHTLLLMDAARAYHREVERTTQQLPDEVIQLLPRMRNKEYTKILVVTLPELTPVQEALQLENDLERAVITPYAWVINQSLAPLNISDPFLLVKQQEELPYIQKLMKENDSSLYLAKWDGNLSESPN